MMKEHYEEFFRVELKINLNKTKIMSRDDLHLTIDYHTVEE